jgi:hypothetical protein
MITTATIIENEIIIVRTLVRDSISSAVAFGNGFSRLGGA